jgi:hypothetical protein
VAGLQLFGIMTGKKASFLQAGVAHQLLKTRLKNQKMTVAFKPFAGQ